MRVADKLSWVGLLLGVIAIVGGQALEGGDPTALFQLAAFVIVIGGTLAAVMLQTPKPVLRAGWRLAAWAFRPPVVEFRDTMTRLLQWATIARRSGFLALESTMNTQRDPFLRKGLLLLIDGTEPQQLRDTLELEIEIWEDFHRQCAKVWEAAGGYAPTVGILGAVLGLIQVMQNLSDPAKLGAGVAVAFVATIYGVGSANLIFLPIANKLKAHISRIVRLR
ncbi:MAG: flagellar motor protein, partial [Betaproteobacteria bacterium]|nr:flagellar motor protein [Betaproteobacteria bacterium]